MTYCNFRWEAPLIRTILYLNAIPGKGPDIAALFDRQKILERACRIEGCLNCELQVNANQPDQLIATASWTSLEAYSIWTSSGGRAEDVAELAQMLIDGELRPAAIYQTIDTGVSS